MIQQLVVACAAVALVAGCGSTTDTAKGGARNAGGPDGASAAHPDGADPPDGARPMSDSGTVSADTGTAGTDARLPAPLAEYWIHTTNFDPDQAIHVRMTSQTEAIVARAYKSGVPYSIERRNEALGADVVDGPPDFLLHGAFVLSTTDPRETGQGSIPRIAVDEGEPGTFGTHALLLYDGEVTPAACLQPATYAWTTLARTVMKDTQETTLLIEVKHEDYPNGLVPWKPVTLTAQKPSTGPPGVIASAANGNVAVDWQPTTDPTVQNSFVFSDWASLVGLEVGARIFVGSTNGVTGLNPYERGWPIMNFGPTRSAPLDFNASAPSAITSWGTAAALVADPECTSDLVTRPATAQSCFRVTTQGGLAVRFAGPVTGIRVRYHGAPQAPFAGFTPGTDSWRSTIPLDIEVAAPNGVPVTKELGESLQGPLIDDTVTLGSTASEAFVVLSVPEGRYNTQTDPHCNHPFDWDIRIDSIEAVP